MIASLGALISVAYTPPAAAQTAPHKTISNGLIRLNVYLPDPERGFYRGTRFEWGGVIGDFTYAGHSFYNPWFTKMEPGINDFIFRDADIVAGEASAITGPAEEFVTDDGAINYTSAPVGGTFVKIGVGSLRKPDDAKYNHYRLYQIVDGGKWTVDAHSDWISVTQRLMDKDSGIGYEYRKTIRLLPGEPKMRIEHSLKNLGDRDINTRIYDHNFLALDGQTTGPDYKVAFPFTINSKRPVDANIGSVDGSSVIYKRALEGQDRFSVAVGGFGNSSSDYHISIENTKVGAGVTITGDHPLQSELLWSIRSVLAVEPFIMLSIPKGGEEKWTYEYTYSAVQNAKK